MFDTTTDEADAALWCIPPDGPHDEWVRTGMAYHDAGGNFKTWNDWSSGAASYDLSKARDAWKSFKPGGGVGAGTLFYTASRYGYTRSGPPPDRALIEARKAQAAADKLAHDAQEALQHADAARAAELLIKAAPPAPESHAYLVKRGVKPHGTMMDKAGNLLVPMRDTDRKLWNVERIDPADTKNKKGLPGGRRTGLYFGMGKPEGVLIVCEGFATGASLHEATGHAVAVAFTAGNLMAVAQALRTKYPALRIVIAADDDVATNGNPGMTKATEAARAVDGFLAVPNFGAVRPDGATDFNDLHQIDGAAAVVACIKAAVQVSTTFQVLTSAKGVQTFPPIDGDGAEGLGTAWPTPEPFSLQNDGQPYPLDALPTLAREAVEEVVGFVKAPVALAASSALSALSVAVQGLYDVERAPGLQGSCSLFMLSIAESGERKTTCDGFFKQALETHQREETERLKPMVDAHRADLDVWEAKKAGLKEAVKSAVKSGQSTHDLESDMRNMEAAKPQPVRVPTLVRGDDTPENLSWELMHGWPSAGVLSSEAGVVFGSHGMGGDSVTRNLALLNVLWDGGSIRTGRRTSDTYTLEGARLTMGLLVQDVTLRTFFDKSKGLARGTGFLARFLVAWPTSTMGTRMFTPAPGYDRLGRFTARLLALLRTPPNIDDMGRLTTVTLSLTHEAHVMWVKFHDQIEGMLGADGELQDVKDVASKIADNAARLACLFHVLESGAGAVSLDAMARGAKLATWHLTEAQRFLGQFALPRETEKAVRLDAWLLAWCQRERTDRVGTRDAQRLGPLRDKTAMDSAVAELVDMGRVRTERDGRKRLIVVNPALLEVAP